MPLDMLIGDRLHLNITQITKMSIFSLFLEVDLQRSTYIHFAFVVLHSRGGGGGGGRGGPGSWLMHFPYVVLHGCFGKF